MSPPRTARPIAAETRTGSPGLAARAAALALISAVADRKQPLDALLEVHGDSALAGLDARDRGLARAIVGVALRRQGEIAAILGKLIEKKLPRRSGDLRRILEVAAAQILFMEVPDHAAVSTALALADRDDSARHFKGLANAVLRRLAREREDLAAGLDGPRLNTPDWLWARWIAHYGADTAHRIAAAHGVEPALDLSVKADADGWAAKLGATVLPNGSLRLVAAGPVEDLPGFAEGAWWVQDAAAALPARLLGAVAGKTVADLCAAPGGKTAQLAAAGAEVVAVDQSVDRLERLSANLSRLGLPASVATADILAWKPDRLFDAVLLDAPCSATGTIRRHPDIAFLKTAGDIAALAAIQSELLAAAANLVKPGGTLVYATCSLEPEEGEDQARRAQAALPLDPFPIALAECAGLGRITPEGWLRTLPCDLAGEDPRLAGLAGFFVARFRRR